MRLDYLFESEEAQIRQIAADLKLPTDEAYLAQLKKGVPVEREHDRGVLDVVQNLEDLVKIAAAHIEEIPDYYDRLKKMEDEATSED